MPTTVTDSVLRELAAFRSGESQGSWENFLYFAVKDLYASGIDDAGRRTAEQAVGITHLSSRTGLRVSAQVSSSMSCVSSR